MANNHKTDLTPFIKYFQAPEHLPFSLPGGPRAALLVHGFPGTPAEMIPLGKALHNQGWTVKGILLPGFGEQIHTLFDQTNTAWVDAVRQELDRLKQIYPITLLGGFSLGAAIAAQAAAINPPDGLALMAPFWKLGSPLWKILPGLSLLFPSIRPFRLVKIDFSDPEIRRGMGEFMPELDLDDPAVKQGIQDFTLPTKIFLEIRRTGLKAWQSAPALQMPVLVLQGTRDETVKPTFTRQWVTRLPSQLSYHELPAAHDLPDPRQPAWPQVEAAVLRFAEELAQKSSRFPANSL